jgi:hypothetical protein
MKQFWVTLHHHDAKGVDIEGGENGKEGDRR